MNVAGRESVNFWRLQALENLEQIFVLKAAEEKKELKNKECLSDRTVVGGFTWAELKAENAMGKKEYFIKKAIF